MSIPKKLLSELAKIILVADDEKTSNMNTMYGTVYIEDGEPSVALDGSPVVNNVPRFKTPVTSTTTLSAGDRVPVIIKDHTAMVIGNLSSPAIREIELEMARSDIESNILEEAKGMYMHRDSDSDGSFILYIHDGREEDLSDSETVIRVSANKIEFSDDGGASYKYGFDVSGTAILNKIYASGIDANFIKTGFIESANGATRINLETGDFTLGAGKILYSTNDGILSIQADNIYASRAGDGGTIENYNVIDSVVNNTSALTSIDQRTSKIEADLNDVIGEQTGFIRFDPSIPRIILGKLSDESYIVIENNSENPRVVLNNNTNGMAEFSTFGLAISQVSSTSTVYHNDSSGNTNDFVWVKRENGHISLKVN